MFEEIRTMLYKLSDDYNWKYYAKVALFIFFYMAVNPGRK